VENIFFVKAIFSWQKKATNGSSFFDFRKKDFTRKFCNGKRE